MSQIITATFEDGVLRPMEPLDPPSHARVRLTVEVLDADGQTAQRHEAFAALQRLWRTTALNSGGDRLSRDQLHERR